MRRQYIGEAATVLEEELVAVVVTPDVTPQTKFDPASLTFTRIPNTRGVLVFQ